MNHYLLYILFYINKIIILIEKCVYSIIIHDFSGANSRICDIHQTNNIYKI